MSTPQDILLGVLCMAEGNRMNTNRVRVMQAFYTRTQDLERVPMRFRKLFEDLGTGGRTDGFFQAEITIWCDRLESALGMLAICEGVETVCSSRSSFYQLDCPERVCYYMNTYFKRIEDEERAFLVGLATEINGGSDHA
jgi:hypothetical protein